MSMYKMPQFDSKILKNKKFSRYLPIVIIVCAVVLSIGLTAWRYFPSETKAFLQYLKMPEIISQKIDKEETTEEPVPMGYVSDVAYEQAIINAAKNVSPSVVSIVISKDLPIYVQEWVNPLDGEGNESPLGFYFQVPKYVQKGTEYREVGEGSGFIVSADGLVLTNKHVVSDKEADYTVFTNDGKKYSAKVLALDPVQDLAVIKIQTEPSENITFKPVTLADSSGIQIGQTAIAIGNSLGQFRNTVSVGVVSGLGRTISASDETGATSEVLEDIIQTDAAINSGNSGGPLLNLRGEVMGINTAVAENAQTIGFAIPINGAKKDIEQVIKTNKIIYPFLGVRYILINEEVKKDYKLSVDYGALVSKGKNGEPAVTEGSAAEKAGIKNKDIILEINGEKITSDNSMSKIIQKHNVGDTVTLRILRDGKEREISLVLGERSL